MTCQPSCTGEIAEMACLLECTARKAGNVHRFADFHDTTYLDFVVGGRIVGRNLTQAAVQGRGPGAVAERVARAIHEKVGRNTHLGIVLLLSPLAAVPTGENLRAGVKTVLSRLTVDDARAAYTAIRLSNPGGLGEAEEQDVHDEPTVTLGEAMLMAAHRDLVARQYAFEYRDVFDYGVPELRLALDEGLTLEQAIVRCHLGLVATVHDSLILRKCGVEASDATAQRAAEVLNAGWPRTSSSRQAFRELDRWLRADSNRRNPGATADVVAASLYAALREQAIPWPASMAQAFPIDDPVFAAR